MAASSMTSTAHDCLLYDVKLLTNVSLMTWNCTRLLAVWRQLQTTASSVTSNCIRLPALWRRIAHVCQLYLVKLHPTASFITCSVLDTTFCACHLSCVQHMCTWCDGSAETGSARGGATVVCIWFQGTSRAISFGMSLFLYSGTCTHVCISRVLFNNCF